MGVAYGKFIATTNFPAFHDTHPPEDFGDKLPSLRWEGGLSVSTEGGDLLDCVAVALLAYDMPEAWEYEVTVLGISSPHYADLFP